MKDLISKIIWKIQMLAMTQLFELFLWVTISGAVTEFMLMYLRNQYVNNIFFEIFFIIFIYYAGYKLILK